MRRAQATARRTGQSIERSMSGMSLRTSQAFAGLRVAASGMGIILGAGLFVNAARDAFQFAAGLTEAARSIGVTVEQLQVLRRAALENGASVEGMERAMAFLNRTLGDAKRGSASAVAAFSSIGIKPEQLRSLAQGGDALAAVTDGLNRFSSDAVLASHGRQLFGRGVAELIPLLRQGSQALSRLTEEMRRSGLVTEEQARRADEAEDALRRLGDTIRINLASALSEAIPYAERLIGTLRELGAVASSVFGFLQRLSGGGLGQALRDITLPGTSQLNRLTSMANASGPVAALRAARIGVEIAAGGRRRLPAARPTDTGNPLDMAPSGSRRRGGTDRSAEQAIRRRHEVESEFNRARIEELRSQQELTRDAATRHETAQMISYLEQQQAEAEIALSQLLKQRTRTEADALADVQTRTFHNQRQAADEEEAQRIAGEQVEIAKGGLDLALELARGEGDLADTIDERLQSQLRILDLQQQQERLELEAVLASKDSNDAQKRIAQARLDMLSSIYQQRSQSVMNANRGPLGDFLNELPTTAARANEALQRIAVEGLGSITDGLADAIMMTRSLGDVFKNIAKQIIADLLRIAIQRSIIGPLTNAVSSLFAGSGGGGGFSGAFQHEFRAAGGPVLPGRSYVVGEKGPELLHMGARGQVISNDNIGGGGGEIHVHVTAPYTGNMATKEDALRLGSMIAPLAIRAVQSARRRGSI